jgi:two-component system, OmpR family, copper resistance phosphate regulon response regulator CusR
MRIVIAGNDPALAASLQRSFEAENYVVDLTGDRDVPRAVDRRAATEDYDAAVLDLDEPCESGLELLREVRACRPHLPILALTSRAGPETCVSTLDAGADDLVLKPFAFSELSARMRALLRRGSRPIDAVLRVEDLELSCIEHSVRRAGKKIDLTPKEFALLEYLMRNAGHCVSRAQILDQAWDLSLDTVTNVVDVYINYLRKKLDATAEHKLIHTVRGMGYQLQAAERSRGTAA